MQWSPTTSIIVVDAKSLTFLRLLALGLVLRPTDEYAAAATGDPETSAELGHLRGDEATRECELREAHRLFVKMGATGHAERLAPLLAESAR